MRSNTLLNRLLFIENIIKIINNREKHFIFEKYDNYFSMFQQTYQNNGSDILDSLYSYFFFD